MRSTNNKKLFLNWLTKEMNGFLASNKQKLRALYVSCCRQRSQFFSFSLFAWNAFLISWLLKYNISSCAFLPLKDNILVEQSNGIPSCLAPPSCPDVCSGPSCPLHVRFFGYTTMKQSRILLQTLNSELKSWGTMKFPCCASVSKTNKNNTGNKNWDGYYMKPKAKNQTGMLLKPTVRAT